jgi:hypothetical protein
VYGYICETTEIDIDIPGRRETARQIRTLYATEAAI